MSYTFNTPLPPEGVHLVSSPDVRGTLDIVWSCVGVMVLLAWETLSFDEVYYGTANAKRRNPRVKIRHYFEKMWYMIVTILAPEAAAVEAAYDHFRSRQIYLEGKQLAIMDDVDWTMTKVFLAMMRGFQVEVDASWTPATRGGLRERRDERTEYQGAEDMQKLRTTTAAAEDLPTTRVMKVNGEQLLYLRKIGVLERLPTLTTSEVEDRDKSNVLVQFLACVQIVWLILSVIVRTAQRLYVTQLEIVTLAFAVLSAIQRGLDWHKPRNVMTGTVLRASRPLDLIEEDALISLENVPLRSKTDRMGDLLCCGLGLLFGGLHCLAWNQSFPTTVEQTLWRVGSLLIACIPIGIIFIHKLKETWLWALGVTYSLVRFLILIETVRALFYQPPSAFRTTWVANIPHFG